MPNLKFCETNSKCVFKVYYPLFFELVQQPVSSKFKINLRSIFIGPLSHIFVQNNHILGMTVAFIAATSVLLYNNTVASCDESSQHDEVSKSLSDGHLSVDNLYFQDTSSTY